MVGGRNPLTQKPDTKIKESINFCHNCFFFPGLFIDLTNAFLYFATKNYFAFCVGTALVTHCWWCW